MQVDLSEPRDMVLVREFDAPRPLVWKCWSEPEHLAAWWGPDGMSNEVELDVRPGGVQVITMIAADGTRYPIRSVFLEVEVGRKLVGTLTVEDHPMEFHELFAAYAGGDSDGKMRLVMSVLFEDTEGGGTRVTVRQSFPAQSERDANMKMGAEQGWRESFVKLDRHLENLSA